jgi:hypothetical protein
MANYDEPNLKKDNENKRYGYRSGLGNVGSYQISGHPFVTGAATIPIDGQERVKFPLVARSVTIINRADIALRVHFTDSTSHIDSQGNYEVFNGQHYITLDNKKDSVTFDIKCSEIFISNKSGTHGGAFELFAELTTIHSGNMYQLTGSGLTEVVATGSAQVLPGEDN